MSRPYRSVVRRQAAEHTRDRVLAAAAGLFSDRGYAPTTIADVAARAEVGVNTVYTTFGAKAALVVALIERASDNAEIDAAVARACSADTGEAVLTELAAGIRRNTERWSAAVTVGLDNAANDPAIAAAVDRAVRRYRRHLAAAVHRVWDLDAQRSDLTQRQAFDLAWFYLGLPAWRVLADLGWSGRRAEAFLAGQCAQAVLRPAG